MKNINKKMWIIGFCILLILALVMVGTIFLIRNNKKDTEFVKEKNEQEQTIYTHQVIDVENIETSAYKSEKKSNLKVAPKYKVGDNLYTVGTNIDFEEEKAQVIYVREKDINLNVIQIKYILEHDKDNAELLQVEEKMIDFKRKSTKEMRLDDFEAKPESESLSDEKKPFGEQIYLDKKEYNARYIVKDNQYSEEEIKDRGLKKEDYTKTYDINIYMDGQDTLVCELVRVL